MRQASYHCYQHFCFPIFFSFSLNNQNYELLNSQIITLTVIHITLTNTLSDVENGTVDEKTLYSHHLDHELLMNINLISVCEGWFGAVGSIKHEYADNINSFIYSFTL